MVDTVELLAKELEDIVIATKSKHNNNNNNVIITFAQWFRIGKFQCQLYNNQKSNTKNNNDNNMITSFQELITMLPKSYWQQFFTTYQQALTILLSSKSSSSSSNNADLISSIDSLFGLLCFSNFLCQVAVTSSSKEENDDEEEEEEEFALLSTLATIYDQLQINNNNNTNKKDSSTFTQKMDQTKSRILGIISFLFLDGLLFLSSTTQNNNNNNNNDNTKSLEALLSEAISKIEQQAVDILGDVQYWQQQQEPNQRTLEHAVLNNISDTPQRQYVINMLKAARQERQDKQNAAIDAAAAAAAAAQQQQQQQQNSSTTAVVTSKPIMSAAQELDRRIEQVRQVLPDFGEGFIETALSYYSGNIETTIANLLNDSSQYPPALRVLDPQLPRRKKDKNNDFVNEDVHDPDAVLAKQVVKDRLAAQEKEQQDAYRALMYVSKQEGGISTTTTRRNEYDDDYDDQYDDMDGGLGGADDGWSDFDIIRKYNQVARQEEADNSFWEENRNTNRAGKNQKQQQQQQNNKSDGDDDNNNDDGETDNGEKKYRGPDKIKGGRVLGPDGRPLKRPGRGNRQKNNNNNNNNSNNNNNTGNNNNNNNNQAKSNAGGPKGKPKTKPKSNNRVNRQRDKKQKAQGNFGVES